MSVIFFFSSRRRHTRFKCDWSSDVCSSDLVNFHPDRRLFMLPQKPYVPFGTLRRAVAYPGAAEDWTVEQIADRSEERRVGEEGRSRWSPYHLKKKHQQDCIHVLPLNTIHHL